MQRWVRSHFMHLNNLHTVCVLPSKPQWLWLVVSLPPLQATPSLQDKSQTWHFLLISSSLPPSGLVIPDLFPTISLWNDFVSSTFLLSQSWSMAPNIPNQNEPISKYRILWKGRSWLLHFCSCHTNINTRFWVELKNVHRPLPKKPRNTPWFLDPRFRTPALQQLIPQQPRGLEDETQPGHRVRAWGGRERISISEDQEKIGKTKLEPKREGILKQDRSGIKGPLEKNWVLSKQAWLLKSSRDEQFLIHTVVPCCRLSSPLTPPMSLSQKEAPVAPGVWGGCC